MKRIAFILMAVLMVAGLHAQRLYVATYNVRNNNAGDAAVGNGWKQRCPNICDLPPSSACRRCFTTSSPTC